MIEVWKDIDGYPNYQVSNMGNVKSLNYNKTGVERILKITKDKNGYLSVHLCKEGKVKYYLIHRLVASTFLDNPNNLPQVNHIDEDKTNNSVENLEFCTAEYNSNFGTRNERIGKTNSIPILQFSKTDELIKKWDSIADIKRELGFIQGNISTCCRGRKKTAYGYKWKYYYKGIWLKNHIPLKYKKVV